MARSRVTQIPTQLKSSKSLRLGVRVMKTNFEAGEQERQMDMYRRAGGVTNSDDERALHMFFSPWTVPEGLTVVEVQECISKYYLREWQRNQLSKKSKSKKLAIKARVAWSVGLEPLPVELSPLKSMTRTGFRKGMRKFNEQIIALLVRDIVR